MQLGSTVCCSFLSSFPHLGRTTLRISWSLVPATLEWWRCSRNGRQPVWAAFALGTVSTSESSAGTGAAATPLLALHPQAIVILFVGVHFPQTQQSWHEGVSVALRSALLTGGISVHVHGSVLSKATQGLGYPGLHQGQLMLSLEYCGIDGWWVLSPLIHFFLGSRKKCEKNGGSHSDLPEGGNRKQIATKSYSYG